MNALPPVRTEPARLALVECWMGPWPAWNHLYEASCRANPDFDFLVFTDQVEAPERHGNIQRFPITLPQIERLATRHAGAPVELKRPWELTKLKTAYGTLFADYLTGYDFWAYHDRDVVWGDLDRFLTPELFSRYDVITASAAWLVGHFTAFRLGSVAARPCELIPGYWDAVRAEKRHKVSLDEEILDHHMARLERAGRLRVRRWQVVLSDDLHPRWRRRAERLVAFRGEDRSQHVLTIGDCRWDGSRAWHEPSGQEVMYFHFQHWKRHYRRDVPPLAPWVRSYRFSSERIRVEQVSWRSFSGVRFWLRHEFPRRALHHLRTTKAALARRARHTRGQLRATLGARLAGRRAG